jgi:hypothetical protein
MTFYAIVSPKTARAQVREIEVSEKIVNSATSEFELAEILFRYGQNDFQPRWCPSVSVGDVIFIYGRVFLVCMMGFRAMRLGDAIAASREVLDEMSFN